MFSNTGRDPATADSPAPVSLSSTEGSDDDDILEPENPDTALAAEAVAGTLLLEDACVGRLPALPSPDLPPNQFDGESLPTLSNKDDTL
jgi:hypothetical protein